MSPPTGEREGARYALLLQKLDLFIDFSAPMEPCPHGSGNKPCCFGVADPLAINAVFREVTEALREIRRRGPALPEKQSPAAPAQPGEGAPTALELGDALEDLFGAIQNPDLYIEGDSGVTRSLRIAVTRARALLERRGGKGLDGKGVGG